MSRILLAIEETAFARGLHRALERAGHHVDGPHDVFAAALRAQIVRPEAAVVDVRTAGEAAVLKRFEATRVSPLIVTSPDATVTRLARRHGGIFCLRPENAIWDHADAHRTGLRLASGEEPRWSDLPTWLSRVVDVVETAIFNEEVKEAQQPTAYPVPQRSGTHAIAPVVVVAARGENARAVVSALVRSELGLPTRVAADSTEALEALRDSQELSVRRRAGGTRVLAVLFDSELLYDGAPADRLYGLAKSMNVPLVPLRLTRGDDVGAVGRAAWEALPPLRDLLRASGVQAGGE